MFENAWINWDYEEELHFEEEWNFGEDVLFFDSSRKETIYENAAFVLVRNAQGVKALKDFCCHYDMPTIWQDDFGNVIMTEEPGFYVWDDDNDEYRKENINLENFSKKSFHSIKW